MHGHPPRAGARRPSPTACATTSSTGCAAITVGNPAHEGVRMGPVATAAQLEDVREGDRPAGPRRPARLRQRRGASRWACPRARASSSRPVLIEVEPGAAAPTVHAREVFGPVATLVPYSGARGRGGGARGAAGSGGLVSSVYSDDAAFTADVVLGLAPYHGRVFLGSAKIAEAVARARAPCCRSSSTAARAAPAAARSWAACAASPSTCSAWPSRARGR